MCDGVASGLKLSSHAAGSTACATPIPSREYVSASSCQILQQGSHKIAVSVQGQAATQRPFSLNVAVHRHQPFDLRIFPRRVVADTGQSATSEVSCASQFKTKIEPFSVEANATHAAYGTNIHETARSCRHDVTMKPRMATSSTRMTASAKPI